MTHARIPDFSTRLPGAFIVEHAPDFADPILAAIERHAEAWAVFQAAAEGDASLKAEDEMEAALKALVATSCASRFGGLALLRHLRWWLGEEAEFSESYQPEYAAAQARASDLSLFLGSDLPPAHASDVAPIVPLASRIVRRLASRYEGPAFDFRPLDEDAPGSIEPWQAVALIRPDTAHVRALRFLDGAGEAVAALALVIGGMAMIGLATLT